MTTPYQFFFSYIVLLKLEKPQSSPNMSAFQYKRNIIKQFKVKVVTLGGHFTAHI